MNKRKRKAPAMERNPLWYKDAVVYELHVRAFADSDGCDIGDFRGLTGKLDYLQGLGVTALWLLPFYPSPPLSERGIKRSPLRDVARMLRSFHYAAYTCLFEQEEGGWASAGDRPSLEFWARFWHGWASAVFLRAYLERAFTGGFLPESKQELHALLEFYLLDKAIYELGYEPESRPDWVRIPLQGLHDLLRVSG